MADDTETDDEAQSDEFEGAADGNSTGSVDDGDRDPDPDESTQGVEEDDLDWGDIEGEIEADLDWGEGETPEGLEWADEVEAGDDISWAEGDGESGEGLAWANDEESAGTKPFPTTTDETGSSDAAETSDQDGTIAPADEEVTADDEMDQAFDDMVDDVETDEVWSEVTEEDEEMLAEDQSATEEPEMDTGIAEVSKHDYCEGCEYLSQAPEIHCTHEGTEILDFADMETVRVSNCPIVAERKGLEQGVAKGSTDLGEIQRE